MILKPALKPAKKCRECRPERKLAGLAILALFFPFCSASRSQAADALTPAEVAKAHGLDDFDKIEEIQFTFNVRKVERVITRKWYWKPRAGEVTLEKRDAAGELKLQSYSQKELNASAPDSIRQLDQWFINDQYWLLFPLHLVWDKDATITNDGPQNLPIPADPPEKATGFTIRYPPVGGYTPGDMFEIYAGRDGLIKQWAYHKSGVEAPTLITTWEQYQKVGPLTLSLLHKDQSGKFQLWFTDVKVKLKP